MFIILIFSINFLCLKFSRANTLSKKNLLFITASSSIVEEDLEENIDKQLEDIDFGNADSFINNDSAKFLGTKSFLNLVKKFINSENDHLFENFFDYGIEIFFNSALKYLPIFLVIIAICITYSLVGQFSTNKDNTVSNLIHIVCFSLVSIFILKIIVELIGLVSGTINLIEKQMEVIFPILLTLMTSIGGVVTVSSFQPILATLTVVITKMFTMVLIPIFIFSIIFNIVGCISKNVNFEKFSKFFSSLFNWIIGLVFTVFISFLSIQGLTASAFDAISFRTAKFAIKSYIPVLGSYLSDSAGLILSSSIIIKNAIGVSGLVVLGVTIFVPIINLAIVMLMLKFTSALLEMINEQKISNFLFAISKSLNMLNVCLLAVGFMYLICLSLLMCCSNIF